MNRKFRFLAILMMLLAAFVFTGCDGNAADGLFDGDNGGDGPTPPPAPTPVPVTGVSLDENELTILVGDTYTLTATVAPDDATDKSVTWDSDKLAIATVDQNGKVTGVSVGTAIITVTTVDGSKTATREVTVLPAGALAGVFSVSNDNGTTITKIHFSQGNLVAAINNSGDPTAWKFAANQYDCLGEGGANKTIGSSAGDIDLFGWSTNATNYGINTSINNSDYSGNFKDWGKNAITNGGNTADTWRTLSNEEWSYLLNTRDNASNLKKYGVTVCDKTNCVIIAPDNWDTNANPLQPSYDATAWSAAEAAGLVCLPAAGFRYGSIVNFVGFNGLYWSATPNDDNNASGLYFDSSSAIMSYNYRCIGLSVRLVWDEN